MKNPFRPTFGASPRVWVGRQAVLDEFARALNNGPGDPHRSVVISGSRGIGKTVLLTELEDEARRQGWIVVRASGREGMVEALTDSAIPEAVEAVNPGKERRITGVTIAGLGGVRSELTEPRAAPRLVTRLRELLAAIDTGVLITIDEVQDATPDDLTHIAVAYQDLVRDDAEIALSMAGLTQGVNKLLDLPGATFLRRARHYELGPLSLDDATSTLIDTAEGAGRAFELPAAQAAARITQGYPYLVQLVGYLAWEEARGPITLDAVEAVREEAILRLGTQVHQPSLRDVPPRQREYLEAMAHIQSQTGRETISVKDLAVALERPSTGLSDTRSKLIERDLIVSAGWGEVAFAQPYLGDFLRNQNKPRRIS
ncbi:ATP-binding protein [Corynebacterium liangguodongii]|uniref:ATP-binding protein n=1 Tax=Corynebacterium liangguodongii TaxID=2079535 RepID=A0A2S0WEQ2_9CORY|nr:ATP-binding protein [Corynebacterium liangguodongii]AWB84230.1 ATP-binding protein [Corynebacterium liangguodongii]PWC00239.1 ATP-binding protein [Corynebacterium liangguodongii]